jgi:hypothetical protein
VPSSAALPATIFSDTVAFGAEMSRHGNHEHYALVLEQLLAGSHATAPP